MEKTQCMIGKNRNMMVKYRNTASVIRRKGECGHA